MRGYASHGLLRLPRIVERIVNGVTAPAAMGRHEWLGDAFLRVDGERGLGPVVAVSALDALKARVRHCGIAIAASCCGACGGLRRLTWSYARTHRASGW